MKIVSMDVKDVAQKCIEASKMIHPHIWHTPIEYSHWLSSLHDAHVYIKWESDQVTGSFKVRGALNKLMTLKEENKLQNGFIAASSGNHGVACSKAMNVLGIRNGTIYVPVTADVSKCKMIEQYGAKIEKHGQNCGETEMKAIADCKEKKIPFVSPYNDLEGIVGQGTIGCEIYKDLPSVDVAILSVGGGGLISGVASYLKAVKPDIKVVGCEAYNSCPMSESVKAGKIVTVQVSSTLSDGTAGNIEPGSITFGFCQKLVDDWVVVTEEEISSAMYNIIKHHHKIVEGSAGLAVAAYIKTMDKYKEKTVVILSCGSNISVHRVKDVINMYDN